jgi:hypothetical protein
MTLVDVLMNAPFQEWARSTILKGVQISKKLFLYSQVSQLYQCFSNDWYLRTIDFLSCVWLNHNCSPAGRVVNQVAISRGATHGRRDDVETDSSDAMVARLLACDV